MASVNKSFRKNPAKKKVRKSSDTKTLVVSEIIQKLKSSEVGMFAGYDHMDDLIERRNLKGEEVITAMMAYNTTLNSVIRMLESKYGL